MKIPNTALAVIITLTMTFSTGQLSAEDITFDKINSMFGTGDSLTKLQKDEAWKQYRGKCVKWTGELVHLDSGFLGGFDIGMKHLSSTFTYDVLIKAPKSEKTNLMTWKQGNEYTYSATLKSYGGAFLPISADWGC